MIKLSGLILYQYSINHHAKNLTVCIIKTVPCQARFHDVFLPHAVGEVNPTVCTSCGILNRLPLFIHFFSDPLCCLHYRPGIKLGKS